MSVNYKRLKKGELVEKCVQAGINHNSKSKRNDLIQLLIENDLQKNNQQLELQLDINTSPKDCHCCSRENNEDGDNNILNLDIPIFNNQESNSEDNGEENGGEMVWKMANQIIAHKIIYLSISPQKKMITQMNQERNLQIYKK